MTDLDTELRAMLRERAGDIDALPAHLTELDAVEVLDTSGRPRHTAWLVAAAIAVVLAIVGTLFAIRPGSTHRAPATTHSPTAARTTTGPLPKTGHAVREISLSWFGMKDLPGYALHMRESSPDYRMLAVRQNGDQGVPVGCNGCESASDYIYVFGQGRFEAAQLGVTSWARTSVAGTSGYLGTMDEYGTKGNPVPTLAWQYRPGSWAIVQGVTNAGGRSEAMHVVADAVEPDVDVPIVLPLRLTYLPTMRLVGVVDDRSEGYAFMIDFQVGAGRNFNITIWPGTDLTGRFDTTQSQTVTIDGQRGYYDPQQGFAAAYRDSLVVAGFGEDSGPLLAVDDQQTQAIMAGLRWGTHSLGQAIP